MQSARPAAELAKNLMANVRAMLSPDLTTETVETVEHLVRLLPQWWALWDRCPSATPFQSPFAPALVAGVRHRRAFDYDRAPRRPPRVGLGAFYIEDGARGRRILPLGMGAS